MTEYPTQEISSCTACRLHKTRQNAVPGRGSLDAEILLLGEAPGREEDAKGEPFVGRAGRLLENIISQVSPGKRQYWIDNVLHCRPPSNDIRKVPDCELTCKQLWLQRGIDSLPNLKVIVCLGLTASSIWFPNLRSHEVIGMCRAVDGKVVIAAPHPAYMFRPGGGEWVKTEIATALELANKLCMDQRLWQQRTSTSRPLAPMTQ